MFYTHTVNFLGTVAMKEYYMLCVILTSVCDTGLGVYIWHECRLWNMFMIFYFQNTNFILV